jgi:uncharacterized protein (TIGR02453 family)
MISISETEKSEDSMTKPIQPFLGFPREGLDFLSSLAEHNNRAWFEDHKKTYVTALARPAQAFVVALGERLKTIEPRLQYDTRLNGSGSIYRIYRDIRFSKDKTPYKTHLDMAFWVGEDKKASPSLFGMRIEAQGGIALAGHYHFEDDFKSQFQTAVDDSSRGEALQSHLRDLKEAGYAIEGEQYQRVPGGYDSNHPRGNLLRYKGLYALSPAIPPEVLTRPELVQVVYDHCLKMAPLHHWLVTTAAIPSA